MDNAQILKEIKREVLDTCKTYTFNPSTNSEIEEIYRNYFSQFFDVFDLTFDGRVITLSIPYKIYDIDIAVPSEVNTLNITDLGDHLGGTTLESETVNYEQNKNT